MVDGNQQPNWYDGKTLKETFAHMLDEDSEIVTIYVKNGEDGSEWVGKWIGPSPAEKYEDVEVDHRCANPSTLTCLV